MISLTVQILASGDLERGTNISDCAGQGRRNQQSVGQYGSQGCSLQIEHEPRLMMIDATIESNDGKATIICDTYDHVFIAMMPIAGPGNLRVGTCS